MFTNFLRRKAQKFTESRDPDFIIGHPDDPYMLRWWWLPRNKFFNVYVHRFLRDDEDRALHDHPWPSLSLLCSGIILEHYASPNGAYPRKRFIKAGDWTYRPAEFAHRLVVPPQEDVPLTIFITGPRIREWGFHCPQGWRHWKDFVAKGNKGTIGVGCGEMELEPHEAGRCKKCDRKWHLSRMMEGYCPECIENSPVGCQDRFGNDLTYFIISIIGLCLLWLAIWEWVL